ncbi:winged helix-turn-helix domain-containing protein [Mycolicibacterium fortuitum]
MTKLQELDATFQRWLGQGYDLDAIHLTLAAAATAHMEGDPLWVLVVAGSSTGKTESVIAPLTGGKGVHEVSTIPSEGALLSGTVQKDRAADATGGLLREVGDCGIVLMKDFTSVLSLPAGVRPQILGALRECYDGSWTKKSGADGGKDLRWDGKLTVIAACTTEYDRKQAAIAAMGDRFVLLRLKVDHDEIGRQSIRNRNKKVMRAELNAAAQAVLAEATDDGFELDDDDVEILLKAARLTTWARTAVMYENGKVVDAHDIEGPARFGGQLAQVVYGGVAIGLTKTEAMALALRVAADSIVPLRLEILRWLTINGYSAGSSGVEVKAVAAGLDKVTNTVDRELKALHQLRLISMTVPEGETRWRYRLAAGVDVGVLSTDKSEFVGAPDPDFASLAAQENKSDFVEVGVPGLVAAAPW